MAFAHAHFLMPRACEALKWVPGPLHESAGLLTNHTLPLFVEKLNVDVFSVLYRNLPTLLLVPPVS